VSQITRRRLEWLIRARGTDLSRWPQDERLAALDLLRRSPEAKQAFVDALVTEEAPECDGALQDRMQATFRQRIAPLSGMVRGLLAGALLACMAAGLYLGAANIEPEQTTDVFASAQTVSFAALDQ